MSPRFLHYSWKETRLIKDKIDDLEKELAAYHAATAEDYPGQIHSQFDFSEPSESTRMEAVLDHHMRYEERFYREELYMRKHIPRKYIMRYKTLFAALENVVSKIDPYYQAEFTGLSS